MTDKQAIDLKWVAHSPPDGAAYEEADITHLLHDIDEDAHLYVTVRRYPRRYYFAFEYDPLTAVGDVIWTPPSWVIWRVEHEVVDRDWNAAIAEVRQRIEGVILND